LGVELGRRGRLAFDEVRAEGGDGG